MGTNGGAHAHESPIEITNNNFRIAAERLGLDQDMQTLTCDPTQMSLRELERVTRKFTSRILVLS